MEEELNLFFGFLENDKKVSNNTLQSYERDLKQYERYLSEQGKEYKEETNEGIKEYITYMQEIGKKSSTISRGLASIRSFYQYGVKNKDVENDPTEQGERAVLNLGHTIGHAIEKLKNFELLHGQCVALGTVAAAYISYKRSYLSDEEFYEIRDMNVGFYLPITVDGLKSEDILAATKSDKKMEQGTIKFILLESVGHAVVDRTVTDEEMLEAINSINGDLIDEE